MYEQPKFNLGNAFDKAFPNKEIRIKVLGDGCLEVFIVSGDTELLNVGIAHVPNKGDTLFIQGLDIRFKDLKGFIICR